MMITTNAFLVTFALQISVRYEMAFSYFPSTTTTPVMAQPAPKEKGWADETFTTQKIFSSQISYTASFTRTRKALRQEHQQFRSLDNLATRYHFGLPVGQVASSRHYGGGTVTFCLLTHQRQNQLLGVMTSLNQVTPRLQLVILLCMIRICTDSCYQSCNKREESFGRSFLICTILQPKTFFQFS